MVCGVVPTSADNPVGLCDDVIVHHHGSAWYACQSLSEWRVRRVNIIRTGSVHTRLWLFARSAQSHTGLRVGIPVLQQIQAAARPAGRHHSDRTIIMVQPADIFMPIVFADRLHPLCVGDGQQTHVTA